jgi:hypothetical protein
VTFDSRIGCLTGMAPSVVAGLPSWALDPRITRTLLKIDPDTRLEQVCDIEAMRQISRTRRFDADRAKSDVSSPPQHTGDNMKANGAALRSKGKWYALTFVCNGTADHLRVLSFSFQIGAEVPKSRWADLGLWR